MTPCRALDYDFIRKVAYKTAKRYRITDNTAPFSTEDLMQESALRLLAGRNYIEGPMRDMMRKENGRSHKKPKFFALGVEGEFRPERPVRAERSAPDLSGLREIDRRIVEMYYWQGLTFRRIGELLGFTEGRAKQIETRAIGELRRQYIGA